MTIPCFDLKAAYFELKEEFDQAYHKIIESGWYILGDEVRAFGGGVRNLLWNKRVHWGRKWTRSTPPHSTRLWYW